MLARRIVSLTALLSFIALFLTSIVSFLAPRGPGSSHWKALNLSKHDWFELHTDIGILFVIACLLHTLFNWKCIVSYMKSKKGKLQVFTLNFNIALIITLWVIISSIANWPPISFIHKDSGRQSSHGRHLQEKMTDKPSKTAKTLPETPPFFYSGKSIKRIATEYELNAERIIENLKNIGIDAKTDWTFKEIANANDTDPASIYEAILQIQ